MAYDILRYASGTSHVKAQDTEHERLAAGLSRLAKTFQKEIHGSQLRGVEASQRQAQTDLIQGTIDPMRRENDEAYAAVVTRNEVMNQYNQMQQRLEDPASEDANIAPDEYVKRLNEEAKKFHEAVSSDPMARTQKRVFNDVLMKVQPSLVAKQADVYRKNMKGKQIISATQALAALPPGEGDAFNLNTAAFISNTLPSNRFTSTEQLNTVLGGALAAARKGDRRLLDYAVSELKADALNPVAVQQAENAFTKAQRAKEDVAWQEAYANREQQAMDGVYTQDQWEQDIKDPETVRRFTAGTINRWRRGSHNARIQIQNIDDATNDFLAGKPLHYDDKTVQQVYGKVKREMLQEAAHSGAGSDAVLATVQKYAGLLARQGVIDKEMKVDFDARFSKPVWTKEAFAEKGFQDAIMIFDELQKQLSNDQLVDQLGEDATKNAFMIQQYVEEAEGDFEKAAEAYIQFQNGIKDRPPIKGETMHREEIAESITNIIDGEIEGHDPAMDRWWGLSSAADESIHTRQLEYELNKVYASEREKGASKDTARKIAETFVGKNAKFFGNELVWTAGAPLNATLGMPAGSTADDRQAAWELFCDRYGLDHTKVHYKQSGQYGVITDADGNEIEELGMFHSVDVGSGYDLHMRTEAEKTEARNQEDLFNDMTNRNRMFETGLNAKFGFNDKAKVLADGTTLGDYKDADEEQRVVIRKTYDEEHRTWLGKLGQKATGFVRDVLDGKFKGEAAERFKTVANQDILDAIETGEVRDDTRVEALREPIQPDIRESEVIEAEQSDVAEFKSQEKLKEHEGFRGAPYKDSVGVKTVGYGRNLEANPITAAEWKAIGGKRDITKEPLTEQEADVLFQNDLKRAKSAAKSVVGDTFNKLSATRKQVVENMAFNLGEGGLSKFKKFLKALRAGDFDKAAAEMRSSKWAKQVGRRADELINMMKKG
jgi:lysozyme